MTPALAGLPGGVAADPKLERAVRQIGENLGIMAAEGERLTAMINDVLDLQKIEAGRMEFRREPVDLLAVVDQSIAATRPCSRRRAGAACARRRTRAAGRSATTTG